VATAVLNVVMRRCGDVKNVASRRFVWLIGAAHLCLAINPHARSAAPQAYAVTAEMPTAHERVSGLLAVSDDAVLIATVHDPNGGILWPSQCRLQRLDSTGLATWSRDLLGNIELSQQDIAAGRVLVTGIAPPDATSITYGTDGLATDASVIDIATGRTLRTVRVDLGAVLTRSGDAVVVFQPVNDITGSSRDGSTTSVSTGQSTRFLSPFELAHVMASDATRLFLFGDHGEASAIVAGRTLWTAQLGRRFSSAHVMWSDDGRSLVVDWSDGPATSVDIATGALRAIERPASPLPETAAVYAALARAGHADAEHHASDINGQGRVTFSPSRSLAAVVIDGRVVLLQGR
jgi:hypothetical protein